MTKITVDVDQKFYDLIIGKLPWAATSIEDFAHAAVSEKMEHLLLLAFNPTAIKTAGDCPKCGATLIKRKFNYVRNEDNTPCLADEAEELYCAACNLYWLPETPIEEDKIQSIQYEQVTVKVPKPIMEFLRKTDCDNVGPESWIESAIVEDVRSYLEFVEAKELADWFKLSPVFVEVLGDKNYKPTTDQEVK